jgi:hypothetical protein
LASAPPRWALYIHLQRPYAGRSMHAFARLLQLAGLTIPPLAMIAQLSDQISAGRMLQFLLFSVCLFGAGYLLQSYRGPRS